MATTGPSEGVRSLHYLLGWLVRSNLSTCVAPAPRAADLVGAEGPLTLSQDTYLQLFDRDRLGFSKLETLSPIAGV